MQLKILESLILNLIQGQFHHLLASKATITSNEITFEQVKEDLSSVEFGFIINSFGKTESPNIISFLTESNLDPKIVRMLLGPIGLFSFWEETDDLSLFWKRMSNSLTYIQQCNEVHGITAVNKKSSLFQISNSIVLKFLIEKHILYICLDSQFAKKIDESIKSEAEVTAFCEEIHAELNKKSPLKKIFPKIQIQKPKEFIIGDFMIPRKFDWGKNIVKSRIKYLREAHPKDSEDASFWYALSLTFDEKNFYLQYGFPHSKMEKIEEIQSKFQSLFLSIIKPILSSKWNQLTVTLQKSASKHLESPFSPLFEKAVFLEYEIRINQTILTCHVIVPKAFIDFLWTVNLDGKVSESSEPLLHFINLNQKWIGERYQEPYQVYFHTNENRKYPILLFEFLSIICQADIMLTIQNYFVANGMKTIDLQKLFFYYKSDPVTHENKLFLDEDFDEISIKKLLPPGMKNEWDLFAVHWENRTGLMSIAYQFDEFIAKNREIMQELFDACKNGKIAYTPQTRYVLYSEFEKLLLEETLTELKNINLSNSGLFLKLKEVPKANVQQFFYSFKSDDLGFVFLDWEKELSKIQSFVSKKFYEEVSEDLAAKSLKLQKQVLDLNSLLTIKKKFVSELNLLTSEEYV